MHGAYVATVARIQRSLSIWPLPMCSRWRYGDGRKRGGMDSILTWLVRFGHVAAAASWAGSYVVLAVVLVPALRRHPSDGLLQAVLALVRLASLVVIASMRVGLVLVARTRGYEYLLLGEWGGIVL